MEINVQREAFAVALDKLMEQFYGEMSDQDLVETLAERIWQIGHNSGIEHSLELREEENKALHEINAPVTGGNA